ncbi:MAG: polymer-forming cytoskeletal protein [Elusimicrobia bacterium]|nr:polymer-forming cytoskeletal protein [Elusimicrobiota bacterium]
MKTRTLKTSLFTACLAVVSLVPAGHAKWSLHSKPDDIRHTDVVIAKGETLREDIVTDKSVTVDGVLEGDCVSFGGPVTIRGREAGDIVTMGGPVTISGLVKGDVLSLGAAVEISGTVEGDVSAIGSNMVLKGTAAVTGDISSVGGHVEKGDKVAFKGAINSVDLGVLRHVARLARMSEPRGNGLLPWLAGGLIGLGLMAILSMLLAGIVLLILPAVFFPKNVEMVADEITGNFWKSAGIGTLIIMALFPALICMLVSIMGIPLIPLALILLVAAKILGVCAFSAVLEKRFFEGIKKPGPQGLIGKVVMGYVLMAGLLIVGHVIPVFGTILFLAGFIIIAFGVVLGLGAVFTTRMGTVEGKKPVIPVPPIPA